MGIRGGAGLGAVLVLRLLPGRAMGHLLGLYLVGLVLSKGDLEPLDINSLSDFLFLLLCLVVVGIIYTIWAFKLIDWIMERRKK